MIDALDADQVRQLAEITEAILGRIDPDGVVMAPQRDAAIPAPHRPLSPPGVRSLTSDDDPAVLRRGLDQLADLLGERPGGAQGIRRRARSGAVQDLVDRIVAAPSRFARTARGEEVDWSQTPSAGHDPAARFRAHAEDLLRAVADDAAAGGPIPLDWQCAELAVHTWDLATALGRSTGDLDAEVAERGLAFMRASLTPDNRSPAFGPEQPAPDGADAYRRIAAFAGRPVSLDGLGSGRHRRPDRSAHPAAHRGDEFGVVGQVRAERGEDGGDGVGAAAGRRGPQLVGPDVAHRGARARAGAAATPPAR